MKWQVIKERKIYHIVKDNPTVKDVLGNCTICLMVQGNVSNQIMSDLPEDRVTGGKPAFNYIATDLFGPFYVPAVRNGIQQKRYGIIFTR